MSFWKTTLGVDDESISATPKPDLCEDESNKITPPVTNKSTFVTTTTATVADHDNEKDDENNSQQSSSQEPPWMPPMSPRVVETKSDITSNDFTNSPTSKKEERQRPVISLAPKSPRSPAPRPAMSFQAPIVSTEMSPKATTEKKSTPDEKPMHATGKVSLPKQAQSTAPSPPTKSFDETEATSPIPKQENSVSLLPSSPGTKPPPLPPTMPTLKQQEEQEPPPTTNDPEDEIQAETVQSEDGWDDWDEDQINDDLFVNRNADKEHQLQPETEMPVLPPSPDLVVEPTNSMENIGQQTEEKPREKDKDKEISKENPVAIPPPPPPPQQPKIELAGQLTEEKPQEIHTPRRSPLSKAPSPPQQIKQEPSIKKEPTKNLALVDSRDDNAVDDEIAIVEQELINLPLPTPANMARVKSPHKSKRFDFLAKEQIPLPVLEERSTKRRHEFHSHLYEMECRLAHLSAQCANEAMNRDDALSSFFSRVVCAPLEQVSHQFVVQQQDEQQQQQSQVNNDDETFVLQNEGRAIENLVRRLSNLDLNMLEYKNVHLHDLKRENLDCIQSEHIDQQCVPNLLMERSKADKRWGTLIGKLDALSGIAARRFMEETSTRKAATELLEQDVASTPPEEELMQDFSTQIATLRAQIRSERAIRKSYDAKVLHQIKETTAAMRRAVLEAAGTGER